MKILLSGGISQSLVNFRGELIRDMVSRGHSVMTCSGEPDENSIAKVQDLGATYVETPLSRRGTNPLSDWTYSKSISKAIGMTKPDVALFYTVKPVIYGSLAAKKHGVPIIASMITGAGAAQAGTSLKERLVSWTAKRLYRSALRHNSVAFFQNPDDEALFRKAGCLSHCVSIQTPGSGVDIEYFNYSEPDPEQPVFLLVARLLIKKGVRLYAEAARAIREEFPQARFLLAGPLEPGPAGIAQEELQLWQREGWIEYFGVLDDVRPALRECSVYVLPSTYGEGQPRTILEAMAVGRAIVSNDSTGCREPVIRGQNGFLVTPNCLTELVGALRSFVTKPSQSLDFGIASRKLAEERYDVKKVNGIILDALKV